MSIQHGKFGLGLLMGLVVNAAATVRYVDLNSLNPTPPFTNWAKAATDIQSAIDVANPGDQVLVTNGVYRTGAYSAPEITLCRVAITKPIIVQSVNGPAVTIIEGYQIPGLTNGSSAVRCAYLTNGASLIGFTLTNGAVRTTGSTERDQSGGGVWCESTSAVVSNCVIINNAAYRAGGARSGTLYRCVITNNYASTAAGAVYNGVLNNCIVIWNTSGYYAGGIYYCAATNCTLTDNLGPYGGAAFASTLNQCTVYGNLALYGGGTHSSVVYNSILYYNVSTMGGDNWALGATGTCTNCCTTPLPEGAGNFTNAPLFIDRFQGNWRLETNSPCINAGNNLYTSGETDLDGRSRIVGGNVDVGAYEYQGPDVGRFIPWLGQYGFATDGSEDYLDADADGMNNWQEWRADTNPFDPLSRLRMRDPIRGVSGISLSWESANSRTYWLERSTNLGSNPYFMKFATNISGQAGVTGYTDTNALGAGPFFYRVGVQ